VIQFYSVQSVSTLVSHVSYLAPFASADTCNSIQPILLPLRSDFQMATTMQFTLLRSGEDQATVYKKL